MLLVDLFLLRETPYRHAATSPRAPVWMAAFVLGTGTLYGALLAWFQRLVGAPLQGIAVADFPWQVLLGGNVIIGVLAALVFHGGATLIVWLMARAVGGPGRLGTLYRATAYLMVLGAPALPRLALESAGAGASGAEIPLATHISALAWISPALLLPGLYRLMRATQGLTPARSALAVFLAGFFVFAVAFAV